MVMLKVPEATVGVPEITAPERDNQEGSPVALNPVGLLVAVIV
jgi:hypothetical protein